MYAAIVCGANSLLCRIVLVFAIKVIGHVAVFSLTKKLTCIVVDNVIETKTPANAGGVER